MDRFKIVPCEPDDKMIWSGNEAAQTCISDDPCGKAAQHVWADMLAAAPPVPKEVVEAMARAIALADDEDFIESRSVHMRRARAALAVLTGGEEGK